MNSHQFCVKVLKNATKSRKVPLLAVTSDMSIQMRVLFDKYVCFQTQFHFVILFDENNCSMSSSLVKIT